jgi:hypothetical protein
MTNTLKKKKCREKVQEFSQAFKTFFGPQWCTYKFHVFQHTPDLVDRHGQAFLWDDFNLERENHLAKEMVTGTRGQMGQLTRHFLLRHHSDVLHDPSVYQESLKEQMKKLSFHQETFATYDDFITDTSNEPVDGHTYDAVHDFMVKKNIATVTQQYHSLE